VAVRYNLASRNTRLQTTQITIDRHWNQMSLSQFNPKTDEWEYSRVNTVESGGLDIIKSDIMNIESKLSGSHWMSDIKRRFVQVTWIAPALCLDENPETRLECFGFIIHNGLILAAKSTCPHDLCDIYIDIDGREVFGQILHIDCRQNWVLIQYDAANTSTSSLNTVELATGTPQELDSVTFVGMDDGNIFHSTKAAVTGSFIADFSSSVQHAEAIDVLQIDSDIARMCLSGVIINESGQIAGFWLIMKNGVRYVLPTTGIASVVRMILAGGAPKPRKTFNFRLEVILPKDARVMGVNDEYIGYGLRANGAQHRFFSVKRTSREVAEYIRHGDIFLSINGKTVNKYLDFDALDNAEAKTAELLIVRDGNQIVVDFPLGIVTDVTTDRVTSIFGMVFQRPYTSIKYITQDFPSDLIITCSVRDLFPGLLYTWL
jgi:pro-apoptotic serine protease NMA111